MYGHMHRVKVCFQLGQTFLSTNSHHSLITKADYKSMCYPGAHNFCVQSFPFQLTDSKMLPKRTQSL
jgi:hypothetical protein